MSQSQRHLPQWIFLVPMPRTSPEALAAEHQLPGWSPGVIVAVPLNRGAAPLAETVSCAGFDPMSSPVIDLGSPDLGLAAFVTCMYRNARHRGRLLADLGIAPGDGSREVPFSEYTALERSAIAFELAMLFEIRRYATLSSADRAHVPDPALPQQDRVAALSGGPTAPGRLLETFRQTRLRETATEIFRSMLTAEERARDLTCGDSYLAATGDGSATIGLLGTHNLGVGYFAYGIDPTGTYTRADINDNVTISFDGSVAPGSPLELRLSAYGFDSSASSIDVSFLGSAAGSAPLVQLRMRQTGVDVLSGRACSAAGTDQICVERQQGNAVVIRVPEAFRDTSFRISVRNSSTDEIQLMVTTNALINQRTLPAEDLFGPGRYRANVGLLDAEQTARLDAFTNVLRGSPLMADIANRLRGRGLVDLSDLVLTRALSIEGRGVSRDVQLPGHPGCPSTIEDVQDLDSAQLVVCFGGLYLGAYRQDAVVRARIDGILQARLGARATGVMTELQHGASPGQSALYELVRAWFKRYRRSLATLDGGILRILSTTDPQGTGSNVTTALDSFEDFYGQLGQGLRTTLDPLVVRQPNGRMGRRNNHLLSALRSVSFLELLLLRAGLAQAQVNRLVVPVQIYRTHTDTHGTPVLVRLQDVPDPSL